MVNARGFTFYESPDDEKDSIVTMSVRVGLAKLLFHISAVGLLGGFYLQLWDGPVSNGGLWLFALLGYVDGCIVAATVPELDPLVKRPAWILLALGLFGAGILCEELALAQCGMVLVGVRCCHGIMHALAQNV